MEGNAQAVFLMLTLTLLAGGCSREPRQGRGEDARRLAGGEIFALWCADCHCVLRDGERVAPDLAGIGEVRSRRELARVIVEPRSTYPGTIMPPFDHFTRRQRSCVTAYVASLKRAPKPGHPWLQHILDLGRKIHVIR